MSAAIETIGIQRPRERTALALVEAAEPRLSVVIPATDSPPTLERCLEAIAAAADQPDEIIVVDHPAGASAATARNKGAQVASGDVLVFIDADVEIHLDGLGRIRAAFAVEAGLTALFGSYDDDPARGGVVSDFRNLLHHHVHQGSQGRMSTFWAGLGAIRREAFVEAGGFAEHPIEDIELGMRLADSDALIRLDPRLQGKHLKRWTLWTMVRTDLLVRGGPWVGLVLRHRASTKVLNLGWRHRLSAGAALTLLGAVLVRRPRAALGAAGSLLALNQAFYRLLLRRRGPAHALAGVALHFVHHLTGVLAVPTGIALHLHDRRGRS